MSATNLHRSGFKARSTGCQPVVNLGENRLAACATDGFETTSNQRGDRREFVGQVMGRLLPGMSGETHSLTELPTLRDDDLFQLKPKVTVGLEVGLEEQQVICISSGEVLFDWEPVQAFLFNRFGGELSLAQIADQLADDTGWSSNVCRERTRSFFLEMARRDICRPVNCPV